MDFGVIPELKLKFYILTFTKFTCIAKQSWLLYWMRYFLIFISKWLDFGFANQWRCSKNRFRIFFSSPPPPAGGWCCIRDQLMSWLVPLRNLPRLLLAKEEKRIWKQSRLCLWCWFLLCGTALFLAEQTF